MMDQDKRETMAWLWLIDEIKKSKERDFDFFCMSL